jgi:nucleoside-diphosphate-sugar epimerase
MPTNWPLIAVTGATGWLGSRVLAALAGGNVKAGRIRALVATGESHKALIEAGIEVVQGDLRDRAALDALVAGCRDGLVIHLAGIIHPPGRTALFDEVNHRATLALHDAAAAAGVRRMVVMSSNSPFGANPSRDHRFTEESPYHPYMGYGRSKMLMEQGLLQRMRRDARPEVTILRAPWFYGPGQPPRQTLFFTMIRQGRFPLFGDGGNRRSMGYVDNLAEGILLASNHPAAAGQTYWLADERPYAMTEIVDTVRAILRDDFGMPVKEKTVHAPMFVADLARLADATLQAAGLYQQKIHVLSEMNLTIACDIAKAKRELGYAPRVELREGMRRSIAWCLERGLKI